MGVPQNGWFGVIPFQETSIISFGLQCLIVWSYSLLILGMISSIQRKHLPWWVWCDPPTRDASINLSYDLEPKHGALDQHKFDQCFQQRSGNFQGNQPCFPVFPVRWKRWHAKLFSRQRLKTSPGIMIRGKTSAANTIIFMISYVNFRPSMFFSRLSQIQIFLLVIGLPAGPQGFSTFQDQHFQGNGLTWHDITMFPPPLRGQLQSCLECLNATRAFCSIRVQSRNLLQASKNIRTNSANTKSPKTKWLNTF